jgi:elongation factor P
MVSTNDMRPGQSILVDGTIYQIMDYAHVKPGKGKAFVKTKLKNLIDGGINSETIGLASEAGADTFVAGSAIFNTENYEQVSLDANLIAEIELLLIPNSEVTIQMYENKPLNVLLPSSVELKVTKAEPAVKGDTVTSSTKTVTCETGLEVVVPMFIEEGEIIKIDTKDNSYMTRV